jgi:hypothetical protein
MLHSWITLSSSSGAALFARAHRLARAKELVEMREIKSLSAVALALMFTVAISATAFAANPQFLPGEAGAKFTGKSGKVTFQIKGGSSLTCAKSEITKGNGELLGPKSALAILHLSSCTGFGLPANSLGDPGGTFLIHVEISICKIGFLDIGVKFAFLLLHIEIPSTKLLFTITGGPIVLITPLDVLVSGFSLGISQKEGKQAIEKCEGEAASTLETSVDGGAFTQTGMEAKEATLTFEKSQELMS